MYFNHLWLQFQDFDKDIQKLLHFKKNVGNTLTYIYTYMASKIKQN